MKKFKEIYHKKTDFVEIEEELEKYPTSLKMKFAELFPCDDPVYSIPMPIAIIVKGRQVGVTTMSMGTPFGLHVSFSSTEDFWKRWNRFQGLKVFL